MRLPFYLYTWFLKDVLLGVTLAFINITIPVQLNSDAVLPCRLPANSFLGENVRWFSSEGSWLTDGTNVLEHLGQIYVEKPAPNEWNLRIQRVSPYFEDTYTCHTASGLLVSSIKLTIETSPRITEEGSSPMRLSLSESVLATLKCNAIGTPEPEISWYRGLSEKYIGIDGPLLKIPDITRYATDEYICRAKNKNGEAERRITVTVNFAPQVTMMEPEVYAAGGEVVTMSCAVQASPLYDAYWTRGTSQYGTRIVNDWKYIAFGTNKDGDSLAKNSVFTAVYGESAGIRIWRSLDLNPVGVEILTRPSHSFELHKYW